jgi:hypothetical protein
MEHLSVSCETEYQDTPQIENTELKESKVCKCCGKLLPLSMFNRQSRGYRNTCKSCLSKGNTRSEKFKDIDTNELIEELRRRGYRGKMRYTVDYEVTI